MREYTITYFGQYGDIRAERTAEYVNRAEAFRVARRVLAATGWFAADVVEAASR